MTAKLNEPLLPWEGLPVLFARMELTIRFRAR